MFALYTIVSPSIFCLQHSFHDRFRVDQRPVQVEDGKRTLVMRTHFVAVADASKFVFFCIRYRCRYWPTWWFVVVVKHPYNFTTVFPKNERVRERTHTHTHTERQTERQRESQAGKPKTSVCCVYYFFRSDAKKKCCRARWLATRPSRELLFRVFRNPN